MRAVKSTNTAPELLVRRLVSSMGYRYRLHRAELPGKPDLAFIGRRKAIFVHGCFWHGHDCTRGARVPRQNASYWIDKIERNRKRDLTHSSTLKRLGWESMVLWECELKDQAITRKRLRRFLETSKAAR